MMTILFFIDLTRIRIHEGKIGNDTSIAIDRRFERRYICKIYKIQVKFATSFIRFGYLLVLTVKRGKSSFPFFSKLKRTGNSPQIREPKKPHQYVEHLIRIWRWVFSDVLGSLDRRRWYSCSRM